MKFTKQSFMGIELDILTGHPEHDILFIATQVARAAGLKDVSNAVGNFKNTKACSMRLSIQDIVTMENFQGSKPKAPNQRAYQGVTALLDEPNVYRMLLRGHAPASEPFRKWVTEVVLPSIRKTGKFDVNEAQDEVSQQYAGEFAELHARLANMEEMLKALMERPVVSAGQEPSPYEGQRGIILPDHFQARLYREIGESLGLQRPSLDRLEARVPLSMEESLMRLWATEDGRELKQAISQQKRKWIKWPDLWLKTKVDREFYRQVTLNVLNEKVSVN